MADVHDRETRSYNMSRIKGKNTTPEILVRKFLFAKGFRYRIHDRRLPGKPDIVLPKYHAVINIHGCFWHGHKGCRYFVVPKTRPEWWLAKISRTKELDKRNASSLKKESWKVINIFECQLLPGRRDKTLKKTLEILRLGNSNN
jgi:DNA mismatch endonuclease (patch repair protein)